MHFFDMCRTERRRLFNISICGKTILIAVCVLAMGVLTFINENPNIEMTDKYFYELFRLYFSRGTFFQLLFVPVGYYIMYGICTDLKEKMSYFFVTRSNINAYPVHNITIKKTTLTSACTPMSRTTTAHGKRNTGSTSNIRNRIANR